MWLNSLGIGCTCVTVSNTAAQLAVNKTVTSAALLFHATALGGNSCNSVFVKPKILVQGVLGFQSPTVHDALIWLGTDCLCLAVIESVSHPWVYCYFQVQLHQCISAFMNLKNLLLLNFRPTLRSRQACADWEMKKGDHSQGSLPVSTSVPIHTKTSTICKMEALW